MNDSVSHLRHLAIHSGFARWVLRGSLGELWRYRDLLFFWVHRETTIRYRQTWLGTGWALAQPVALTLVFWITFHAGQHQTLPHALPTLLGSVAWLYFSKTVLGASSSIVVHGKLITRVCFPRLVIPLAIVIAGLLDLGIGIFFGVLLAIVFGYLPGIWSLLALGGATLLTATLAYGLGTFFGALHVRYRDVGYALTFVMQLWFLLTPLLYLPAENHPLWMELNPLTGIFRIFRTALFSTEWDPMSISISLLWAFASAIIGTLTFRATEDQFADVI